MWTPTPTSTSPATLSAPDRTFLPSEVVVPGFLPDLPDIRKEIAQYCSSVRRCDQSVGQILRALHESGLEQDTLVMFLSDNGMSMPFAKSNCYLASTCTPWIVRWPGKIRPAVDDQHFISAIDFMPTILDAANVSAPPGMDGRSFLPLLAGQSQAHRNRVFTCYNDNAGGSHYPMHCVQTKNFGYIYNPWSNGKTEYRTEPMTGLTFPAMRQAASTRPDIAARIELLIHRVPEEFYDLEHDPACLHNLIAEPEYQERIKQFRTTMVTWMHDTQDPCEEGFHKVLEHPTPVAQ